MRAYARARTRESWGLSKAKVPKVRTDAARNAANAAAARLRVRAREGDSLNLRISAIRAWQIRVISPASLDHNWAPVGQRFLMSALGGKRTKEKLRKLVATIQRLAIIFAQPWDRSRAVHTSRR